MPEFIRIPERYEDAYRNIATLRDEEFDSLIDALKKCEASADVYSLLRRVKEYAPELDGEVVEGIVEATIPLFMLMERSGDSLPSIIAALVDAVEDIDEFDVPEAGLKLLPKRLERLLTANQAVVITAKASALLNEFSHVFCDARIVTDIRPVFSADISEEEPTNAMIVHTLRLSYHDNKDFSKTDEIYISLDTSKLRSLQKIIDRALSKTTAVERRIASSGMSYLATEKN